MFDIRDHGGNFGGKKIDKYPMNYQPTAYQWEYLSMDINSRLPNANELASYPTAKIVRYITSGQNFLKNIYNDGGTVLNTVTLAFVPGYSVKYILRLKNTFYVLFNNNALYVFTDDVLISNTTVSIAGQYASYIDDEYIITEDNNTVYFYNRSYTILYTIGSMPTLMDIAVRLDKTTFLIANGSNYNQVLVQKINSSFYSRTKTTSGYYSSQVIVTQLKRIKDGMM